MHRWKHPDLWLAAGKWKRRTWRMDLISVMQKKCAQQKQQAGLTKWRRWALCRANPVLKGRGRRAIRRWQRVALMTGSVSMCRLKSPFARMKAATRDGSLRRRRLLRAVQSFRNRAVVTAYNTWEAHLRAEYERKRSMRATLSGWLGGTRSAFNTWRRQLELMSPAKVVAARWLNATMYAFFRRWSTDYKDFLLRLRSGLGHWLNAAMARGLNSWKAQFAAYRTMLHAAVRLLSARLVMVLNTWIHVARTGRETMTRMTAIIETMRGSKVRAGLNQWRDNTLEAAARGKRMRGALSSMSPEGRAMRMGLNSWIQRAEQGAKMRQAGFMMRNASLKKAVNGWQEMAFAPNPMHTALMRWAHQKFAAALATWCEFIEERRLRRKALAGMANAPLSRGFRGWRAAAEAQAERLAGLDAVLGNMSPEGRAKRKAYNSWAGAVAQMALMRRAAGALFHRKASLAFNAWSEAVAALHERHERMAAALRKFSPEGRAMMQALNSWKARKEMHRLMLRAGASLFYAKVRKAFSSWDFIIQQQYRIHTAAYRMLHARLSAAWNTWQECAVKPTPMKKAAGRMRNRPLAMAFGSWLSWYEALEAMRRSMSHLVNRGLSKGLRSWLEYLELLDVMQRAMSGMRNNGLRKGFNGWVTWTEERFEALATMERGLSGMKNGPMRAAFNSWTDKAFGEPDPALRALAHFANRELSKGFLSWVEATAQWLVMMNAVGALKHREAKAAVNQWRSFLAEQAEKRAQMAKTIARMTSPAFKAFNQWSSMLEGLYVMRGAAKRLLNRQLSKCFESWQARYEETMLMRRAAGAIMHAPLARAIGSWREYLEAQAADRALAMKAVLKMTPRGKAFNTWAAQMRALYPLKRAMKHWQSMQLVRALGSWEEMVQARESNRRAMAGFLKSGSRKGLDAWKAFVREKAKQRRRVGAALKRLSPEGRAMTKALNQWGEYLSGCVGPRERALKHMLNLALSKGWKSWTNMVDARASARRAFAHFAGSNLVKAVSAWEEYAESERTMRGALRRLFSRQLSQCFETWQEAMEQAMEQKRRMRGILAGFGGPKRKALNTWKGHLEDLLMMKRSLARLVMGAQARAVGTWVAYIEARAAQAKRMHDALSGKSGALRYGLGRWAEFVEELRLVRKALGGLRGGGLKRGLAAWVDFVESRFDSQALARKAVLRVTPRGKAWNSWLSYLESLVVGRRALSHMVNAGLSKCWGAWGAYLDMLQEKRMCLAHLFNRDLSRAWRAWEHKVAFLNI